ncbi:MAG TPA: BREX-3 system phosphatase PglZ [Chloroflexi bacterium]|nr:BREX-3 system phosphatase PglZ [Chloroflexota bacterium]
MPRWAQPAIVAPDEDWRPRRAGELLAILGEALQEGLAEARWPQWQTVARVWAEFLTLRAPDASPALAPPDGWSGIEHQLDTAFDAWMRQRYAPIGSQRLPVPHHVHHLPHFIAYERRQGRAGRVALLILDGLALSDWILIGTAWRARHADWQFQEHLVLAQVPTITAISRQALVSGLRPADFGATLDSNRSEAREWATFWAREGLVADACPYVNTRLDRDDPPPALDSARTQALCLVDPTFDALLHGAGLGTAGLHASLRVWLDSQSAKVEEAIETLLAREFTIYLASDHGHVEAQGIGQPSEGLTVQTRGKRARLYRDERAALAVRATFQPTVLWSQDGLLPDDVWVLMPQGRKAFAPFNDTVVTHGGLTLDEVVVPLVTITRS